MSGPYNNDILPADAPFNLGSIDDLLTAEECAAWFKTSQRQLGDMDIVAFKPSHRVKRYHPRTILAVMAVNAGVPLAVIAASYGEHQPKK